jgi:cobalamin biosynthesis protein CbiG
MNLYRVKLKGMQYPNSVVAYGIPYVVANSADEALKIVQEFLDKEDIGSDSERVMESIELLAEEKRYPDCTIQLFISGRNFK